MRNLYHDTSNELSSFQFHVNLMQFKISSTKGSLSISLMMKLWQLSETEEGFVSTAKKSAMANRRGCSELMWKETEKRIGEDWVVELRLCLVVVRAPFMEK